MKKKKPEITSGLPSTAVDLVEKLEIKSATIAVIGMGYVGLPLTKAILDAGLSVIGFDTDESKIAKLRNGENYLSHLGESFVDDLNSSGRLLASSEESKLRDANVIILCVPTPLGSHDEPDLSAVINSVEVVARHLQKGQLVVLESTTYPGTTRGEVLPILRRSGLELGKDFFLAYSPEREDPGRAKTTTSNIPKLVGGVDEASTRVATETYQTFISTVHQVATAEIAESAKLMENIYRAVNIALINEMKIILDRLGIDVWEVIEAASSKPFGFHPFFPGPGLGGHCIPVDPFYLTWKAKAVEYRTRFIELAGEINRNMPEFVVSKIAGALNENKKPLAGSRILIIGVAYKKDVDDLRESPALRIMNQLYKKGAAVMYHDPHIQHVSKEPECELVLSSIDLTEASLQQADCVVITTDHTCIDYTLIGKHSKVVVDTRNAMHNIPMSCKLIKS